MKTISQPPGSERNAKIKNVIRVSSGNFLEMYDFIVFGFFAGPIGRTFFPGHDPYASLMLSLATFGAGFLMRPVGAVGLGAYIDRYGRRAGLLLTLGLMSVGTFTIACLPGYATIGLLAPVLILLSRLLQGFSAGVELGGVSVYLSEIATPGHKGFYVSWQSASQQVAVMVASLLGVGLELVLAPATIDLWGWRIPFLVGCLIIPLLFLLRRSLAETEAFEARKHHPTISQIIRTVAANWTIVLLGMMLVAMTTVSFYLITAYTPTFGQSELHLQSVGVLIVTLCVGLSNFCWLPVMGAASDRFGRKPLLNYLYGSGAVYRIPRNAVVDSGALLREVVVGTTLAVIYLRQLQWRHGRHFNRDHAGRGSDQRILTGLQPRDGFVRRIYPGPLYLSYSYYREPCRTGALDVVCGAPWFNCRLPDSTSGERFGRGRLDPPEGVTIASAQVEALPVISV